MAVKRENKFAREKKDPVYNSVLANKFINSLMRDGKKTVAMDVFYNTLDVIGQKMGKNPYEIFEKAIENVKPKLEIKTKRVGGANYQIPVEVRYERKLTLSIRWILEAVKGKKGRPMANRLADELIAAYKNEGAAIKKRTNVHKMAEANKVFAYFKW